MNFRSNVLAMLTGTAAAQAIPLLASPILTRLFTPEAFGLQTLFMSIAAMAGVLATCRLDLAVVLPDSDKEARDVAVLAIYITGATFILSFFCVLIAAPLFSKIAGYGTHTAWLWILPIMITWIALFQLSVAFSTRERNFYQIAKANVSNQLAYVLTSLSFGILGAWLQGLAFAKLAGQTAALTLLSKQLRLNILNKENSISFKFICQTAKKYQQFFLFNTPYSLVSTISRDAPIFIFSAASALSSAGLYGLARTIVMAPTLLLSNALSQVFFREAVTLQGQPKLPKLTLGLLNLGFLATAPLFAFFVTWGDIFFGTLFGTRWQQAGVFTMLLAPAAWMSIQTGWPERLFEVHNRQGVSFTVQLGSDIVTALATAVTFVATRNALLTIAVFSILNTLYHHLYLATIFHIASFSKRALTKILLKGWLTFGFFCGVLALIRLAFGNDLVSGGIAMFIAGLAASTLAWRLFPHALPVTN